MSFVGTPSLFNISAMEYNECPSMHSLNIYLMILDSDTDRIVYNRHCFGEYNPLKDKHIEKALKRTFSDFAD